MFRADYQQERSRLWREIPTGHTPDPAQPERYGRTPEAIRGAKENKKSFAFLSNNNVGLYPEHPLDF